MHAFADAARISLAPLRDNDNLRAAVRIGVLAFSSVVLSHELLILLIVLLLLVGLAHYCVLLLEGVVVAALELRCIVITAIEAIIELALIARHLLITIAAAHSFACVCIVFVSYLNYLRMKTMNSNVLYLIQKY